MHHKRGLGKLAISPTEIKDRLYDIATQINYDYKDKTIYVCIVMHSAMVFASDLIRKIKREVIISTVLLKSYDGESRKRISCVGVQFDKSSFRSEDVLILEDIADTGTTLYYLQNMIKAYGPRSLQTAVLLDKSSNRTESIKLDYVGFSIKDKFLVGYGMDYKARYRNLPGLWELGQGPSKTTQPDELSEQSKEEERLQSPFPDPDFPESTSGGF